MRASRLGAFSSGVSYHHLRAEFLKFYCAPTQSPKGLVKMLVVIHWAWKPELRISNQFPGDANAAGPGPKLSQASAGIPTRDPDSASHSVFILPAALCLEHTGPLYILEEWIP